MWPVLVLFGAALGAQVPPALPSPCDAPRAESAASQRAAALGYLAARAWLEMKVRHATNPADLRRLHDQNRQVQGFISAASAGAAYSVQERALMQRDLGGWTRADVAMGSWAMEASGTLLWAVQVVKELPAENSPLPQSEALRPFMVPQGAERVALQARLRPGAELARARHRARWLHWAIRQRQQRMQPGAAEVSALRQGLSAGVLGDGTATELRVAGLEVGSLTPAALELSGRVAGARLDALNWLCR